MPADFADFADLAAILLFLGARIEEFQRVGPDLFLFLARACARGGAGSRGAAQGNGNRGGSLYAPICPRFAESSTT